MNHHNDQEGTDSYIDTAKRHCDEIDMELSLKPHADVAAEKWIVCQIREKLVSVYLKTMNGEHVDAELIQIQQMFNSLE